MYLLKYSEKDKAFTEVEERLYNLSLGFKSEYSPGLKTVTLFDDREMIAEGLHAIKAHLDQVSGELRQWYYCDC